MTQCRKVFIDTEKQVSAATKWIRDQFQEGDFPYFDFNSNYLDKNNIAEIKFLCLSFNANYSLNDWCEDHLTREQWRALKHDIRL